MRDFKFKYLLLLSTVLGAGLGGTSTNAACTSYTPSSNTTVTCSGSNTSGISANSTTSNITVILEDGASLSTTRNGISLSGSGNNLELRADSSISSSGGTAINLGSNGTSGNSLVLYGDSAASAVFYAAVLHGSLGSIALYDNSTLKTTGSASAIFINGNYNSIDLNDSSLIQTTGTTNAHGIVIAGSGNTITVDQGASIDANGSAIRINSGASNRIVNYGSLVGDLTAVTGSTSSDVLENYGLLVGNSGTAVSLGGGDDTLLLGTGSSITGNIDGGSGTDTVTLLGTGSEDNNFSNFESLTMAGTSWTLSGTSTFDTIALASGSFTNSGMLTASGGLSFTAAGASLVNSGTLVASITGSSGTDTITNYGTISGSMDLRGGDDALTLGIGSDVTGSIDGGDGTDDLTLVGSGPEDSNFTNFESLTMAGSEWVLSGTSSFGSILVDSGILRLNGSITGGVQVAAAGTLGGTGTIYGDVTSFGTLSAGNSVGTATIVGDLVQNGGSFVEFDASGIDRWNVTGTATLVNNPTLTISSLDGSTTAYGVILHADGGITGSFADPPIYDGNGAVSIEQTDEDIILTVVDGASLVADHQALLQTGMSFFDQLRFDHSRQPGGRGTFWLQAFGQSRDEEEQDGNEAYEYSFGGAAAGWETKAAKGTSLGVSLGLSSSDVEIPGSASVSSARSLMGAMYSNVQQGSAFLSAALGAGGSNLDLFHTAAVGTERLSVETDTNAWLMGAALQAGVELISADGWSIVPSARLAYLHQWVEGYREEIGSASANIDAHDTSLLRLRGDLELRHLSRQEGIMYVPHLKLGLVDDIALGEAVTGAFASGTPFELSLSGPDGIRALGGIGLEAEFQNGSHARIGYEGEASSSSLAHALTFEVKVYW